MDTSSSQIHSNLQPTAMGEDERQSAYGRAGGSARTPLPPRPPLDETREQRRWSREITARRGVEWRRGGSRPAPAERGRDRHWQGAASCPAVLVLEFLEACAVRVRARRGAVGASIARSHLPTVGRLARACPRRTSPHLLASPANVHAATSTHRGVFTSPALLPAAGCRGERPSSRHVAPQ